MRVYKKSGTKDRLFEMFENVNKIKINESFDSPIAKDKEYLDNTVGDQGSQVSKYDDGTRYPVEPELKTKDPSLEKLKGDDAPIVEAEGEDDQDVADKSDDEEQMLFSSEEESEEGEEPVNNDSEEKPAWDEDFGGDQGADALPSDEEEPDAMPADSAEEEAPELADAIGDGSFTDELEGGLADDAQPNDFCPVQIAKGIQIEMEHTSEPQKALEIAMDHLTEIPDYYDRLESMEAEAKGEGQGSMEDDAEAPEDALLDPSKHWVDDYAPTNVSMGDDIEADSMDEDQNQGSLEDKYAIYFENADDGNGNDITTGEPLLSFDEWLNN